MARKSKAKPAGDVRQAVMEAALALAAAQDWDSIRLSDIAGRAGIGLAELRDLFGSKLAILAGFAARIDRQVLDSIDPELAAEPPRDRLFDVMMSRFDALQPYREAMRSIGRSFARRPADLLAWNPVAVRSMTWMLEGAGISASGRMGCLRAQGLALVYARTLRVWLDDDDPGMARTMVALDKGLRNGESWLGRLDGLCAVAGAARRAARRRGRARASVDGDAGMSPG
jgi:ubiquinone biosynthesis protein COQ9